MTRDGRHLAQGLSIASGLHEEENVQTAADAGMGGKSHKRKSSREGAGLPRVEESRPPCIQHGAVEFAICPPVVLSRRGEEREQR